MQIQDYGNTIILQFQSGLVLTYNLPHQKTEGLNHLFECLQNLECSEDDFKIHITKHGITRVRTWASTLLVDNWVEKILTSLR